MLPGEQKLMPQHARAASEKRKSEEAEEEKGIQGRRVKAVVALRSLFLACSCSVSTRTKLFESRNIPAQ